MIEKRYTLFSVIIVFSFLVISLHSETIRDRAEFHFNMIDWTTRADSLPTVELPGVNLPGGNESFSIISATSKSGLSAIYPEIDGLGTINYSGTDTDLLSLMHKVATDIENKKLDSSDCDPGRSFIGPIFTYQLSKLPAMNGIVFSCPLKNEDGFFSSTFRMECIQEGHSVYVFFTVKADKIMGSWKINEVLFDGESYADLAQQN